MSLPVGAFKSGGKLFDSDGVELVRLDESAISVSVVFGSTSKGYQQLAAAGLATPTVPSGATQALIYTTADVRWRDDGTNPTATVGNPLFAGERLAYDGDQLAALRFYGTATFDIQYFA